MAEMCRRIIFILFLTTLLSTAHTFNPLIRRTLYGFVRGTLEKSKVDPSIEYFSFMGVPYAHPPVGELRFQEPERLERWTGIKDTNKQADRCVQFSDNFDGHEIIGKEDCLYLNIFIPKTVRKNKRQLMPVMFWIHGGGFIFGGNVNAGPDYVMEEEVVLVTIQYRLNVFGFLSTLDKHATGNFGLKDQSMALRWVQENIKNFEGDPKRVMILGESAGGASVQYHILSPRSRGLFQRAISHSGSTMNRWGYQENPREMVLKLAKGLGIRDSDSKTLIEKLQDIDHRAIITAAFNKSVVGFYTPYYAQPFCPSTESESDTAFISKSTFALLEEGNFNKVPYITGYNTEEGSYAYHFIEVGRADMDRYQENPELIVPFALNISKGSLCSKEVTKRIKQFYFKNGPMNDKANWIMYMSQELFNRAIRKSVELMYKHLPLRYYRFSYRGSRNESFVGGVGHHEELMYLWYSRRAGANTKETPADRLTRRRFVTLWTNFAATGNPTPKSDPLLQNVNWPLVNQKEKIPFLNIGDDLEIGKNPNQEDYEFWEKIFDLCGNPPYTIY